MGLGTQSRIGRRNANVSRASTEQELFVVNLTSGQASGQGLQRNRLDLVSRVSRVDLHFSLFPFLSTFCPKWSAVWKSEWLFVGGDVGRGTAVDVTGIKLLQV